MLSFITRCTARLIGLYKPLLHSKSNMVCPSPHSLLEVQCCSGYVLPPPYEEHFLRSLSLILSPLSDLVAGGLSETSSSLLGGSGMDCVHFTLSRPHYVGIYWVCCCCCCSIRFGAQLSLWLVTFSSTLETLHILVSASTNCNFAYDVLKINIKIAHRVIMKHQSRRYYFGSLSVH
ncbi:uncharacterized protein LOC107858604 isoform X1 [Capsicum annuum]|uniref:uncharacterized protein LOC107858604 isoform X1 n=1 Tax=Capsicum annuum TaxID=4072 RepID=UPI001FB0E844|nr:uncharacterized protein LOC107858604 isoform X1 [Capsicum annuum]